MGRGWPGLQLGVLIGGVLIGGVLSGAASAGELSPRDGGPAAGLELVLEARGLPGASSGPVRRLLSLGGPRARLIDPLRGQALHLEPAGPRWVAVDLRQRARAVPPPGWDLVALEARRVEARRQALATWRERRAAAVEAKDEAGLRAADEALRRSGMRADGAVALALEPAPSGAREAGAREVSLLVDGERRQVRLERWVLRQNQGVEPLAELWVAPGRALGDDPLRPFRGLLGPEASARLETLPGPVLEARLRLLPGAPPLELRVLAARHGDAGRAASGGAAWLAPPPWPQR